MIPDFTIQKGDLLSSFEVSLRGVTGELIDLSEAESVQFRMRRVGDTEWIFARNVTVVDAPAGRVRYDWQEGDTDNPGYYESQFVVTLSGRPMSFPSDEDDLLLVNVGGTEDVEWVLCTPEQARGIVRKDVGVDNLALAQTVIAMHANIRLDAEGGIDDLDPTDQTALRQAVAFQGAWLSEQPDYLTRINVSSESADGESRNYTTGALQLAPLAAYALSNSSLGAGSGYRTVDTPRDYPLVKPSMEDVGWRTWR